MDYIGLVLNTWIILDRFQTHGLYWIGFRHMDYIGLVLNTWILFERFPIKISRHNDFNPSLKGL